MINGVIGVIPAIRCIKLINDVTASRVFLFLRVGQDIEVQDPKA